MTGTIDQHGRVGLVGGIKGKTLGARDAGFDLMLVPKAEAATARSVRGLATCGSSASARSPIALAALRK